MLRAISDWQIMILLINQGVSKMSMIDGKS